MAGPKKSSEREIAERIQELERKVLAGETQKDRVEAMRELGPLRRLARQMRKEAEELKREKERRKKEQAAKENPENPPSSEEIEQNRENERKEEIKEKERKDGKYTRKVFADPKMEKTAQEYEKSAEEMEELARFKRVITGSIEREEAAIRELDGRNEEDAGAEDDVVYHNLKQPAASLKGPGLLKKVSAHLPGGAGTILVLLLIIALLHMIAVPIGDTGLTRWQLLGEAMKGQVVLDDNTNGA